LVTSFTPTIASTQKNVAAHTTITTLDGFRTVNVTNTGANVDVTLPAAADNIGRILEITKVDSGNQIGVKPATGDTINVYGVTAVGPSTVTVLERPDTSVLLECVSATVWRVIQGGAAISRISGVASNNLNSSFDIAMVKVQQVVFARISASSTWANTGAEKRTSNSGYIPSAFRPGNETIFSSSMINAERVTFTVDQNGVMAIYASAGTQGIPFGNAASSGSWFTIG
jgi:hypothetical protein